VESGFLKGLDSDGTYRIKDYDTGLIATAKGSDLAKDGLTVCRRKRPDSALFHYRRL
jgi:hypothetical protein